MFLCGCSQTWSHDEQTKRAGAAFTPGRRRMALSPMVCACLRHALLVRKILPRSLKRQTSANVCKCSQKMAQPCATLNAQNGSNCAIYLICSSQQKAVRFQSLEAGGGVAFLLLRCMHRVPGTLEPCLPVSPILSPSYICVTVCYVCCTVSPTPNLGTFSAASSPTLSPACFPACVALCASHCVSHCVTVYNNLVCHRVFHCGNFGTLSTTCPSACLPLCLRLCLPTCHPLSHFIFDVVPLCVYQLLSHFVPRTLFPKIVSHFVSPLFLTLSPYKVHTATMRLLDGKIKSSPTLFPTLAPNVCPSLSPTLSPTLCPNLSRTLSPALSLTFGSRFVSHFVSRFVSHFVAHLFPKPLSSNVFRTLSLSLFKCVSHCVSESPPTLSPTLFHLLSPTWSPTSSHLFPTLSLTLPNILSPTFFSPALSPTLPRTCFQLRLPLCFPFCPPLSPTVFPLLSVSQCVFHPVSLLPTVSPSVFPTLSSLCLPPCRPARFPLCPSLCLKFCFPLCFPLCCPLCLSFCFHVESQNVAQTWTLLGSFFTLNFGIFIAVGLQSWVNLISFFRDSTFRSSDFGWGWEHFWCQIWKRRRHLYRPLWQWAASFFVKYV